MPLFGTAGIRGSTTEFITPALAESIGRAAGYDARQHDASPEFVVGRDGRVTGDGLTAAVSAGLQSVGVPATHLGQVPTPTLAFGSRNRRGVMVTASHNPPSDNGIKLFVDGVEYDTDAEQRITSLVENPPSPTDWDTWTTSTTTDILPTYREAIIKYARSHGTHLDDLEVVIDCGNGTASHATPTILNELGASIVTLHANVDGSFPGRPSKPTPETLTGCQQFIADGDFDLGIAHDGDGDRVVFLDTDGAIIHEDTILAILARHFVAQSSVADPVVITTPNASARVDEQVDDAGGDTVRTALGTLHEEMARIEASDRTVVFAGEPWKHIHPQLGGWIDGIATAAIVSRLVASQGLSTLRAPVTERPYRKLSIDCPKPHQDAVMERLATDLPALFDAAELSTAHGVRITRPDGAWILARPSGTEPKIRLYVEADDADSLMADVEATVQSVIQSVA